ncbi:MAG: Endonuclease/exonuclease/phosphatase [Anaerocolumna sp.]|nr:Endonuclease/exonuclease/phosphatase [Anaerocolumna sp.]
MRAGLHYVMGVNMKIVTLNIRCDYKQDGNNNFEFRKSLIFKRLVEEQPDVIGFQEVLPHVVKWLKENLTDYYIIGCGREKDLTGEQACIAYRKDLFNLIKMETFWLSETPGIPGSRYENQSECPRTCTVAYLHDLRTAKVVRIYNTHLDHIGSGARKLGLSQIMKKISQDNFLGSIPFVLVGDFNALPDSEEISVLEEYDHIYDCTVNVTGTFHDFGRLTQEEKIDYIIADRTMNCIEAVKWTDCEEGVYLSDHYPVCV